MGFIKNPSKSIKNSIYHKVTIDPIKFASTGRKKSNNLSSNVRNVNYNKNTAMALCALGFIGLGGIHDFYLGYIGKGIVKFFTMNWFLIGTIIDLIKILNDSY